MESIVTSKFVIHVDWLPASHGSPEIRETSALLEVTIGDNVATRFDDAWSKSMQRSARVSVYPLALWIASSWWRLRWESPPFRTKPDTSWRMAHEMPGAGHGYLWPLLTFASDGEAIDATCRPSNPLSAEPVRYVADFHDAIEAPAFERALDEFVGLVLARLDAVGLSGRNFASSGTKSWRNVQILPPLSGERLRPNWALSQTSLPMLFSHAS